jgi:GNAT superfamily N-acetyltransferase
MKLIPSYMMVGDESQVRALYKVCHPGAVSRPIGWYFAHPTLVIIDKGVVVGHTSFTVTLIPGFGQTMYGMDVCVDPKYRGKGIGTSLHAARLTIAYGVGARIFMGVTNSENKSMIRILERAGAHACVPVGDDTLYVGSVTEV